jgi:hypothetical protein
MDEKEIVLEGPKSLSQLAGISINFKMNGGFNAIDIPAINELFKYFTGLDNTPTDCRAQMIYRCQCVASNYYKIKR